MALPAYEPLLNAYHAAFESEIRKMIAVLPIPPEGRVIDVGSGDGFFAGLLAERLTGGGTVTCVDADPAYLAAARDRLSRHPCRDRLRFVRGDVRALPFEPGAFDFAWCAQSFYSFPEPLGALREMARVVGPGGVVAVMENDAAHQVLLPWPPDVELALQAAELASYRERHRQADRFYVGRGLWGLFRAVGLAAVVKRTFAWDRLAPFDTATGDFLARHVAALRERTWPHLADDDRAACEAYLDPASPDYVLAGDASNTTVIDHVFWGRRPPAR